MPYITIEGGQMTTEQKQQLEESLVHKPCIYKIKVYIMILMKN